MTEHETITGPPESYRVVSRTWLNTIVGLMVVLVLGVLYLGYNYYLLQSKMRSIETDTQVLFERKKAFNEMMQNRAEIERFSYNRACILAKSQGQACIDNPRFWADPDNYPILKDNNLGLGLFPGKPEN